MEAKLIHETYIDVMALSVLGAQLQLLDLPHYSAMGQREMHKEVVV